MGMPCLFLILYLYIFVSMSNDIVKAASNFLSSSSDNDNDS